MATFCLRRTSSFCVLSSHLRAASQRRCYSKQYSRYKEEVIAYSKFKKELKASRFAFQKEIKSQQEMSMEEFNAQAAEEANQARELEQRALEANKIELERMALKREKALEKTAKRLEDKFLRGTVAREAWEDKRTQEKAKEVAQIQEESASFITLDNLDQTIQEIVDNEVDYNFALSKTGEIITRSSRR